MAERTLTPSTWLATCVSNPQSEGRLTKTALEALAAVKGPTTSTTVPRAEHWPSGGDPLCGAMWLGVIQPSEAVKDSEGCWTIQTQCHGDPAPSYMRIAPAGKDDEVQYGFCPLRLDRRAVMLHDLFPDGEIRLGQCSIRVESSSYIRMDKITITAARLNEGESPEAVAFQMLLKRLNISLGDLIEDLLRHVYTDRCRSVLNDRSDDYRDLVYLLVNGGYPGTLPPATTMDVQRFLACVTQASPYVWNPETIHPVLGTLVLPAEMCAKVSRNMEAGLPPIVPQWCTAGSYQYNGPWHRPCTGIEYGGRDDKILAGVCNAFNTDLMGPLAFWPTNDTPSPDWVQCYMDLLDEVLEVAMPVDTSQRVDLLLEMARRVPIILQEHTGPVYVRVLSFVFSESKSISDLVIQECDAVGVLCGRPLPAPGSEPEKDGDEDEDEDYDVEDEPECDQCGTVLSDSYACSNCGESVCGNCWSGECETCGADLCTACQNDHHCEGGDNAGE